MPKSSRKKKEKAADFAKAKLKLGKGKQVASNATDTSFKSRSIALPKQTVSIVKDASEPTTRRNLSLSDLVAQLKHYSPSIRKDALAGLKEILAAHPEIIEASLSILINACVRLISDEDVLVRKTLVSFLSWLLPLAPRSSLLPHVSILLLFTSSALSHIFPEIRVDAVRFVDLLLDIAPRLVVSGWIDDSSSADAEGRAETSVAGASRHGQQILHGYLGLFELKGRSGEKAPVGSLSGLVLSANSKLVVLKSFYSFLQHSIPRTGDETGSTNAESSSHIPTWYFSSSFATPTAYHIFAQLLRPSRTQPTTSGTLPIAGRTMVWQDNVDVDEDALEREDFSGSFALADISGQGLAGWTFGELESAADSRDYVPGISDRQARSSIADLSSKIHSVLVSTFLDAAPSVFSPSEQVPFNITNVELVWAVGQIAKILYGALLSGYDGKEIPSQALEDLYTMLGHMSPYFPFDAESIHNRDPKSEQLLQDLSLAYCELTSLLVLPTGSEIPSGKGISMKVHHTNVLAIQVEWVAEYVTLALHGQVATASQPLGRSLSAAAYMSLSSTLWLILNLPSDPQGDSGVATKILEATIGHAMRLGSHSAVKCLATEFVGRIYLVQNEPMYCGPLKIGLKSPFAAQMSEWVLSLPRLLWELGTHNLSFTEIILLFLLRISQRQRVLLSTEDINELCRRLVPYLGVEHPSRGVLTGPYVKIPAELQRLVLDVVITLSGSCDVKVAAGLIIATDIAVGSAERSYWDELQRFRAQEMYL